MAILLYFGVPGAGKSYEVVSNRVLPALMTGRRVVTNIRGLDIEKIKAYIKKHDKKYDINKIGSLVSVDNDLILQQDFFPYFDEEENPVENTFIQRDDYLILDESWRFFPDSKKMTQPQESFFAEHRHFSIDIILINQTSSGINKYALGRVESLYECCNLKRAGLKRYVVHTYSGNKAYQKNKISSPPKKFKSAVFDLYNSYANGKGAEKLQSDSIYKSPKFLFCAVVFCIAVFVLFHGIYNYVTREDLTAKPTKIIKPTNLPTTTVTPALELREDLPFSSDFKISGVIKSGSGIRYIITNGVDFIPLASGLCRGVEYVICEHRGFSVTRYTGIKEVKK